MNDAGSISRSDPIAFFLTWTTYGSWLPGDDRGWVDPYGHFRPAEPLRAASVRRRMVGQPVSFDVDQRAAVENAIEAHCQRRGWHLHAVQCRSQHVHVVVSAADYAPDEVMAQLKSWCTRRLKTSGRGLDIVGGRRTWWTEGGSKRRIFHEGDLASVVAYVKECQGVPTPRPPSRG
jgi:REP element-mobilizing transposase RayT